MALERQGGIISRVHPVELPTRPNTMMGPLRSNLYVSARYPIRQQIITQPEVITPPPSTIVPLRTLMGVGL